eukprot:6486657-Amphidinium_carterae.1
MTLWALSGNDYNLGMGYFTSTYPTGQNRHLGAFKLEVSPLFFLSASTLSLIVFSLALSLPAPSGRVEEQSSRNLDA